MSLTDITGVIIIGTYLGLVLPVYVVLFYVVLERISAEQ